MAFPKSNRILLYISLIMAVPVYWAAEIFLGKLQVGETEAVAFAATLAFFFLLFLGWYLPDARPGMAERHYRKKLGSLSAVFLVSFIVLAVHADLQLKDLPGINLLLFWLPFILLSLSLGSILRVFIAGLEQRFRQADLSAAQSRSELQLLQSQLSPHFLFNTLNSLYGLSINDHHKVPALLVKLSDLLRYSIYDVKEMFVPLSSEIAYIQNYIDFEKIRIGERLELKTAITPVTSADIQIAPMLLIVFVENAFKHAKNTHSKNIRVEISLQTWENRILFAVKNSYEERPVKKPDNHSGLGLDNTMKRLKALYPDQHQLLIEKKDNQYIVNLQLMIK